MLEDEHLDEQHTPDYFVTFTLAWNDWIIVKNELEGMWSEAMVA